MAVNLAVTLATAPVLFIVTDSVLPLTPVQCVVRYHNVWSFHADGAL